MYLVIWTVSFCEGRVRFFWSPFGWIRYWSDPLTSLAKDLIYLYGYGMMDVCFTWIGQCMVSLCQFAMWHWYHTVDMFTDWIWFPINSDFLYAYTLGDSLIHCIDQFGSEFGIDCLWSVLLVYCQNFVKILPGYHFSDNLITECCMHIFVAILWLQHQRIFSLTLIS